KQEDLSTVPGKKTGQHFHRIKKSQIRNQNPFLKHCMNTQKDNNSRLFSKVKAVYQSRAEKIASNREKLSQLLRKVSEKMKQVGEIPSVRESKTQVEVLYRMVKAHL